jgi:hypothetical protein
MIEFKEEWARGMDGEQYVSTLVLDATGNLNNDGGDGASRGIDYALAAACLDADDLERAYDHLGFIIKELQHARDNMREELRRIENEGTQAEERARGFRTVTIPACVDHGGMDSLKVTLKWLCPKCGEPRGEPYKARSYDGSRILDVDAWDNPCGHIDTYSTIRAQVILAEEVLKQP